MKMDGKTIQICDVETIAHDKGRLVNVSYEQRRRDGERQRRKREIYDNGNSAVILPYDPDRKTVLLTRQLRLPVFLQDGTERTVEARAGKLDGEQAEQRIVKEMQEELGYRIAKVQPIVRTLCESGRGHGKDLLLYVRLFAGRQGFRRRRAQGGGGGYRRRRSHAGESRCDDRDRRNRRRQDGHSCSIFEPARAGSRLDLRNQPNHSVSGSPFARHRNGFPPVTAIVAPDT